MRRFRALAVIGICSAVAVAALLLNPVGETVVAVSEARRDGFEVVVQRVSAGGQSELRSLPIDEAENLVSQDRNYNLLLSGRESDLEAVLLRSEQSRGPSLSAVSIQYAGKGKQQVRLHFSYSNRSVTYSYWTDGRNVFPLTSQSADLGGTGRTRYVNDGG
jgi:hypothetical protein